jgi:lipid A 3-O-deacylase
LGVCFRSWCVGAGSAFAALIAGAATVHAAAPVEPEPETAPTAAAEPAGPLALQIAEECYFPTHRDRAIESTFLNLALGYEWTDFVAFSVWGGVTLTHAWGYIVQLDEHFHDVMYTTAAFGAGPLVGVRFDPLHALPVSLPLDVVGALVLYDKGFPAGGDIYNFTWRLGGSLAVHLTEQVMLTAGVRWMHVSNGQGLGPQNPSYEAVGVPVSVVVEAF